jgi:hypothetical protein
MNLDWKIRMIDRLIKRNPDSTIRDYLKIVDMEEEEIKPVQCRVNGKKKATKKLSKLIQ